MKGRKPNLRIVEPDNISLHAARNRIYTKRYPAAPAWFPELAKQEWNKVAPILHRQRLLAADTVGILTSYCIAVAQVREAEEIMAREGRILIEDGKRLVHPAFRLQQGALREARLHASELGLTPHRRSKQQIDQPDAEDAWAGLLS